MPIVYTRKRKLPPHPQSPQLPTSTPSTRNESPPSPPSKRRKLIQLHIDAGQPDIAARKCSVCNMLYTPGATDDAAVHRAYHASHMRSKQPPKLAEGLRCVSKARRGSFHVAKAGDVQGVSRFVRRVDEWVARYLGDWTGFGEFWMVVVYVEQKVVKGYLYGERVSRVMDKESWKTGNFCGVGRVWVMEAKRRKGIATSMIDVLRRELEYGFVFPEPCVAFSATTASGTLLANAYAARHGGKVLMYALGSGQLMTHLKPGNTLL